MGPAKSWSRRAGSATWPLRKGRGLEVLETPFLSNYSHKVNENWSRQLIGHLTLDEKE